MRPRHLIKENPRRWRNPDNTIGGESGVTYCGLEVPFKGKHNRIRFQEDPDRCTCKRCRMFARGVDAATVDVPTTETATTVPRHVERRLTT